MIVLNVKKMMMHTSFFPVHIHLDNLVVAIGVKWNLKYIFRRKFLHKKKLVSYLKNTFLIVA